MPSTAVKGHRTQSMSWSLAPFVLKRWLRGRWAVLFSHPDDFANYGFEADRWIAQVKEAFHAESVAALAVSPRAAGDDAGWIAAVGGCSISPRTFDSVVVHSGALAHRNPERRCVLILDDELRVRRTFVYEGTGRVPSPIGLASLAAACRVRALSEERRIA